MILMARKLQMGHEYFRFLPEEDLGRNGQVYKWMEINATKVARRLP